MEKHVKYILAVEKVLLFQIYFVVFFSLPSYFIFVIALLVTRKFSTYLHRISGMHAAGIYFLHMRALPKHITGRQNISFQTGKN